jgi:hypothetical protein
MPSAMTLSRLASSSSRSPFFAGLLKWLPFQLTIGSTVLPVRDGSMGPDRQGEDLEEQSNTYPIENKDWDYYANNITVQILRRNQGSGTVYTISHKKRAFCPFFLFNLKSV